MKQILLLMLMCVGLTANAQFALELTGLPEECAFGGSLSWSVTGTDPDGSVVYSISKPNDPNFDVVTTTQTTLEGLNAGLYKVIAVETISSGGSTVTNQDIKEFTILDEVQNLEYNVSTEDSKCDDGEITFSVPSGKGYGPFIYRVKQNGTVVGEFTSTSRTHTFTDLAVGDYTTEVTDKCDNTLVKTTRINEKPSEIIKNIISDVYYNNNHTDNCDVIRLTPGIQTNTNKSLNMNFPMTGVYEIFVGSSTDPIIIEKTFTSFSGGSGSNSIWDMNLNELLEIPFTTETNFTINATITDACGQTVSNENIAVTRRQMKININKVRGRECGAEYVYWNIYGEFSDYGIEVLEAPAEFDINYFVPNNGNLTDKRGYLGQNTEELLPLGDYSFRFYDQCGREDIVNFTINKIPPAPSLVTIPSCEIDHADIRLTYNTLLTDFEYIIVTSAPQEFLDLYGSNYSYPLSELVIENVSSTYQSSTAYFINVPQGNYTFEIKNTCGDVLNISRYIDGYTPGDENIQINELCGSFELDIQHTKNDIFVTYDYYIQKYFEDSDSWGKLDGTGVRITDIDGATRLNSQFLFTTTTLNYNGIIPYTGKFRIVRIKSSSFTKELCVEFVQEFEIKGDIEIVDAFSFQCADGTYDILIEAEGSNQPLTYKILRKDGQPFVIENGTDQVFEGLPGGVYDFEVTDDCGNKLVRRLDITKLDPPQIKPIAICEGQTGYLAVNGIDYLNFEWYKEGEEGTILSTTNQLEFADFDPVTDQGTYKVKLTSPTASTTSCVNTELSFTIDENSDVASAGADQNVQICYPQGSINLLDYLDASAQKYGSFTEVTSSNALSGTNFFANLVEPGSYTFKYNVEGSCNGTDEAIIVVNTKENVPPEFVSCPSDVYIPNNNNDPNGQGVPLPVLEATDNCAIKSITSNKESGSVFPVGDTQVIYTATDTSGNTTTCSFTITVAKPIDAVDDNYTVDNGYAGQSNVGNVLGNDTLNGLEANTGNVNITVTSDATPVTPGANVPYIDNNGNVIVPADTPKGDYVINYSICEREDTNNCSTAIAKVSVLGYICNKQPSFYGTPNAGPKTGVTHLNKFRNATWLTDKKNAFLAIDGVNKGLVITRSNDLSQIAEPVEGMIVWDIQNQCISLYTVDLGWHCIQQGCNE